MFGQSSYLVWVSVLCFPDKLIIWVRLAAVCNNFGLSFATDFQKSTLTIRAKRVCCQLMFCQGHQQNVSYVIINFVLHFNFILMISNDMKKMHPFWEGSQHHCIFSGIYPYRSQVSGLRMLMLSCMTELSVEVLKITKHPNEAAIKVRWRIKGVPLIRKLVPYLGRKVRVDSYGYRYTLHWIFLGAFW